MGFRIVILVIVASILITGINCGQVSENDSAKQDVDTNYSNQETYPPPGYGYNPYFGGGYPFFGFPSFSPFYGPPMGPPMGPPIGPSMGPGYMSPPGGMYGSYPRKMFGPPPGVLPPGKRIGPPPGVLPPGKTFGPPPGKVFGPPPGTYFGPYGNPFWGSNPGFNSPPQYGGGGGYYGDDQFDAGY